MAALEKLKLPIHQELPQSLQDGPLDGSAAQDTEAVVDALRDKGHQAAATGDAVSAVSERRHLLGALGRAFGFHPMGLRHRDCISLNGSSPPVGVSQFVTGPAVHCGARPCP